MMTDKGIELTEAEQEETYGGGAGFTGDIFRSGKARPAYLDMAEDFTSQLQDIFCFGFSPMNFLA